MLPQSRHGRTALMMRLRGLYSYEKNSQTVFIDM